MLKGRVWEIQRECLVLDVQGTGYLLIVPYGLLAKLSPGQETVLYTHLVVREDDLSLYGFASLEEKRLFLEMLSVSGIGPKAAMSVLSALGSAGVQAAISSENVNLLTKAPGIGKKTAQRLILELKEKFKGSTVLQGTWQGTSVEIAPSAHSEALETLLALGFGLDEARQALGQALKQGGEMTTEEQVMKALKFIGTKN